MALSKHREAGIAIIAVLAAIVLIGGLASTIVTRAVRTHNHQRALVLASRLLVLAESGLASMHVLMSQDSLFPVKDQIGYSFDTTNLEFVSNYQTLSADGKTGSKVRYRVQYLAGGVPVTFADRSAPSAGWDELRVLCESSLGTLDGQTRVVGAWYTAPGAAIFGGTLVSDAADVGGGTTPKARGQAGNVVLSKANSSGTISLFGSSRSNGRMEYWPTDSPLDAMVLDDASAAANLDAFSGTLEMDLQGTGEEVPDYTTPGGIDQLFDFGRYRAAAAAGAGAVHLSIPAFVAAMNAANALGEPLEGIQVIHIDPAIEGSEPRFVLGPEDPLVPNDYQIAGGLNIRGTLVYDFVDGTDPRYRLNIDVPVNINPADLTGLDVLVESTYTTGYPPTYTDPTKQPHMVDVTGAGYDNFLATDDHPAWMANSGIVDVHRQSNVCGVVYSASFVEIEMKVLGLMYFNGAIYGGDGVLLENRVTGSQLAIRFDPQVIDMYQLKYGTGAAAVAGAAGQTGQGGTALAVNRTLILN